MHADVTRAPAFVPFAYGFRPFFFLAAVLAIEPVVTTALAFATGSWPEGAMPIPAWHAHEMLFGFVAASMAGFLLTAVPTWTGTKAVSGAPLIGLVAVWLAGRVTSLPWLDSSSVVLEVLGVAFFPALAVTLAVPLVRTGNFRNMPFLLLLTLLFVAELVLDAQRYGWTTQPPLDGVRLAVNTVTLAIVIVGGRIVPAFTRNALLLARQPVAIRSQKAVDVAATVSVVAVLIGDLVAKDTLLTGLLAAASAVLLCVRLTGWNGLRTRAIPLLWVLHLGYWWLVVALGLKALWLLGGFAWATNWLHAFTAGAFGTMILGVMTRVALGHTGRPLKVPRTIVASYVLAAGSALGRVFGPWLAPGHYVEALAVAAAGWTAAFAIFLAVYTPILVGPRADGKPG